MKYDICYRLLVLGEEDDRRPDINKKRSLVEKIVDMIFDLIKYFMTIMSFFISFLFHQTFLKFRTPFALFNLLDDDYLS
jgi:hypothetical protein